MKIQGNFYRHVLPSMLAFALSGVYAIADGFFVGNAMGDSALAAVTIAYPLTAFMQAAGTGVGMGGAVRFAICAGAKDEDGKHRYFTVSMLLLLLFGALLTVFFLLFGGDVLHLFGAQGEILALSKEYILFVTFGAVFQVLGTGVIPFIRNMGGSITAMAAMIAGFAANIALDYLFVWVFSWGMMGAAVATDIGQAVTFFICLGFLLAKRIKKKAQTPQERSGCFFLEEGGLRRAAGLSQKVLAVALSPFGLTFSPNLTLIFVNRSAISTGGDYAVTCYAAISYICSVVLLLLQGISDGNQPLVSMEFGKNRLRYARDYRNLAYKFSAAAALVCSIVLFFFRGQAAALFGASESVVADVAVILPVFLAGYLFVSFSRITTSYFYATEENALAYILIYGEPLCLLLLLLILPRLLGLWGTWAAVPLSQIVLAAVSAVFTIRRDKRIA